MSPEGLLPPALKYEITALYVSNCAQQTFCVRGYSSLYCKRTTVSASTELAFIFFFSILFFKSSKALP